MTRTGLRIALLVVLFGTGLAPLVLFVLDGSDPSLVVGLARGSRAALGTATWLVLVTGSVLLLIWPPFVPALRLGWKRLRSRMTVDQGPMHAARERLQHLETSKDHVTIGMTNAAMGDATNALTHFARAVELEPESLPARYQLGRLLARVGQVGPAADQLGFVVERDPSHAFGEALLELGRSLARARRDAEAVVVLERHETQYGPHREALLLRARALRHLGRAAEARPLLAAAAAPPEGGRRLTPEEQLARALARVALWRTPAGASTEESS